MLHHCDNPRCVRPEHLFLGTPADNMRDKVAKGRQTKGTAVNTAKMNAPLIAQLRESRLTGRTYKELAQQFGLSIAQVWKIVTRKDWKHVP